MKFSFDIRYSLFDILRFKKIFKQNALKIRETTFQNETIKIYSPR